MVSGESGPRLPGPQAAARLTAPPTDMAGQVVVSSPALAAALLLFLTSVSGSSGPRSREIRGAPRIPSNFSEEERVAIKEALKGEPPPPCAQRWVPRSPVSPALSPPGLLAAQARLPRSRTRSGYRAAGLARRSSPCSPAYPGGSTFSAQPAPACPYLPPPASSSVCIVLSTLSIF